MFVDNGRVLETTDNTYLEAGMVGLVSTGAEINVRNFKVLALP
jgi:hypothetical protein